MGNSCKRPGSRFAVASGMRCDNCKGWVHESCTDPTVSAYIKRSKSDRRWVCDTCNMDDEVFLGNIIILFSGLWKTWSANLKKRQS